MLADVKLMLFLSSYSPLFAIFILRDLDTAKWCNPDNWMELPSCVIGLVESPWASISMLFAIVFPLLRLWFVLVTAAKELEPENLAVTKVVPKGAEVLNYIATYIIPFTATSLNKLGDALSLLVLFLVMSILYIRANLYHINPVLGLAGFRIFEIELSKDRGTVHLITRSPQILIGAQLRAVNIVGNIFLEVI